MQGTGTRHGRTLLVCASPNLPATELQVDGPGSAGALRALRALRCGFGSALQASDGCARPKAGRFELGSGKKRPKRASRRAALE